ncbi:MAG: phosphatidate cytidylyltransferase [Lachnospiraceae bacterium]|nr:phosphatidate cytidylyltransferase [Lachnospiraceae bacterium]MDN4741943.1 phosphatidate cytidylyltransferase [Lachnospiraceae bacterium C1.1]
MLRTRVLSGAALVIILAGALYLGGYFLWTLLLFASLVGLMEFYRAVHGVKLGETYKAGPLEIAGIITTFAYYLIMCISTRKEYLFYTLVISLIFYMIIYVVTFPRHQTSECMQVYFGEIYVSVMLSFIYLLWRAGGLKLTVLIFISSWVCDTFAYFAGRALGKHKLAPVLSPKKSVEGSVGGVLGALLLGALYAYLISLPIVETALICAFTSIISQFGDLFASAIKRNHEIKDYGNLIPGHGGILDRFDSVIITAPFIYVLCEVIL